MSEVVVFGLHSVPFAPWLDAVAQSVPSQPDDGQQKRRPRPPFLLPMLGLFLSDRCLHDAKDFFRLWFVQWPRRPLFS